MAISTNFYKISLILIAVSINRTASDSIFNLLRPSFWIDQIINIIEGPSWFDSSKTTTTTTTTTVAAPVIDIQTEEAIFNLAHKIQTFYDPSDLQAKENYIISPLSVAILLGELLLGTHGVTNYCLVKILGLNPRKTRDVTIFKETYDAFYDQKLYYSAYHFRISMLHRNQQTDEEQNKVKFSNALFCKQDVDISENFKSKAKRFYNPDFIPIDLRKLERNSVDPIYNWSSNSLQVDIHRSTRLVKKNMESILVNTLLFNTTWRAQMGKLKRKAAFSTNPYKTVDVKYLKGTIKDAIYVSTDKYTLVAVPLDHKSTHLYIMLPEGNDLTNYNIRRFSESLDNYEEFKNSINNNKEIRDVVLTVPNIFSRFVEIDLVKPLLNFINSEIELVGKEKMHDMYLNMAAKNLKVNKVLQHVYISIENKLNSTVNITTKPRRTKRFIDDNNDKDHKDDDDAKKSKPPIDFKVTRPFVFIVMDHETNLLLLWGSISNPVKLQK